MFNPPKWRNSSQDAQSVGFDTKEKRMTMNDMKEKKFYLLCSYKEVGRPVGDDELRDAFDEAVYEASCLEPEADDDGDIDYLSYAEEVSDYESRVAERMLERVSPEIKAIVVGSL